MVGPGAARLRRTPRGQGDLPGRGRRPCWPWIFERLERFQTWCPGSCAPPGTTAPWVNAEAVLGGHPGQSRSIFPGPISSRPWPCWATSPLLSVLPMRQGQGGHPGHGHRGLPGAHPGTSSSPIIRRKDPPPGLLRGRGAHRPRTTAPAHRRRGPASCWARGADLNRDPRPDSRWTPERRPPATASRTPVWRNALYGMPVLPGGHDPDRPHGSGPRCWAWPALRPVSTRPPAWTCSCPGCWPACPSPAWIWPRLGHGGMCMNCKTCNFPKCPFGR